MCFFLLHPLQPKSHKKSYEFIIPVLSPSRATSHLSFRLLQEYTQVYLKNDCLRFFTLQNISILVVLMYSWQISVNMKKYQSLGDVYFGKMGKSFYPLEFPRLICHLLNSFFTYTHLLNDVQEYKLLITQ